jgi:hypothetical protein
MAWAVKLRRGQGWLDCAVLAQAASPGACVSTHLFKATRSSSLLRSTLPSGRSQHSTRAPSRTSVRGSKPHVRICRSGERQAAHQVAGSSLLCGCHQLAQA